MDTPGANASQILKDATQEDIFTPIFLFPEDSHVNPQSWKFSDDKKYLEFCIKLQVINLPRFSCFYLTKFVWPRR